MEQTLQGVQGVVCYLDDLLITGMTPADHWNGFYTEMKQVFFPAAKS